MYDRGENYVRKKSEKGRYPAGPTIKVDKFHREIKKIHREIKKNSLKKSTSLENTKNITKKSKKK